MSIKRNNLLFMWLAILVTAGQLILSTVFKRWGLESLIPYLACMVLGLILIKKDGGTFSEVVPYKTGIKGRTALLIVALVFLLFPLTTLLSQAGALIGGDLLSVFMLKLSSDNQSFPEMLFTTAVIPAVFEELFFRGFLFAGFKKARGGCFAIIMTSVLFGFFHMNIQQIAYAAVLGIVLGILREVTGSIWAGCLYHFVNNGWATLGAAIQKSAGDGSFFEKLPLEAVSFLPSAAGVPSKGKVIYSVIMLIVCTALAVYIIISISRSEGRLDDLKRFFKRSDDPKGRVVTFTFVVACFIYVSVTALMALALKLMPDAIMNYASRV